MRNFFPDYFSEGATRDDDPANCLRIRQATQAYPAAEGKVSARATDCRDPSRLQQALD